MTFEQAESADFHPFDVTKVSGRMGAGLGVKSTREFPRAIPTTKHCRVTLITLSAHSHPHAQPPTPTPNPHLNPPPLRRSGRTRVTHC